MLQFRFFNIAMLCVLALAGCKFGLGNSDKSTPPPATDLPTPTPTPTPTPPASGLDQRPSNTKCLAGKRPATGTSLAQLQPAFPNLTFNQPVAMVQAPNSSDRWYVAEKPGRLMSFANNATTAQTTPFIDLTAQVDDRSEGGLLGVAFHPDYATNGYVFLSYTTSDVPSNSSSANFRSVIARFTANGSRTALDASSELVLMTVAQPYDNHDGGNIAFGPDGFLYIGFGDGGSGGDPEGHGQDSGTLLAAMLRIDVNVSSSDLASGVRYKIPSGNPFTGAPICINGSCPNQIKKASRCAGSGCPEIFAWGLRNPWRWSFDRLTGDLWAGDVGQDTWEEVDLIKVGKNYGWNCYEGSHVYNAKCVTPLNLVMPITEYDHSVGNSITGGYVYRGSAIPALTGTYVFADFGSGKIFGLSDPTGVATRSELTMPMSGIASFAQDNDGEIYALNLYSGQISKFVPGSGTATPGFPAKLSDTGCAASDDPKQGSSGMIPFDVNAVLWSDGATKQRWLALPDAQSISINADGDFQFPAGSVLRKDFYLDNKIVETRLLAYHTDGDWAGYSYEWNDAQSDALLVADGKTKTIGAQSWFYPSGSDCLRCHTLAAGRSLGPEIMQLNRDYNYASPGKTGNQLFTYASIGLLDTALPDTPPKLAALPSPQNTTGALEARARAYLHANCSHCHRPGGPGRGGIDLRYDVAFNAMGVCNKVPETGDLGVTGAQLLVPGNPGLSLLSLRMHDMGINRMPPLGRSVVDTLGTSLIDAWITALSSCP